MNVTFGCSHTAGTEEGGCWTEILQRKHGLDIVNHGKAATGFFQTIETARHVASKAAADGVVIRRVILQKPMMNRYPWYCAPEKFEVVEARKKFNALPDFGKKALANKIFKIEAELLEEFVSLFPEARFAYWHYWYDYHSYAPRLIVPFLDKAEALAQSHGMDSLGMMIDAKSTIDRALKEGGEFNSKPFIQSMVDQGWLISLYDGHGTKKFNEAVADRVKEWCDALDATTSL